jgi:hypothetical protein
MKYFIKAASFFLFVTSIYINLNAQPSEDDIGIIESPDTIIVGVDFSCKAGFEDIDGTGTIVQYWNWKVGITYEDSVYIVIAQDSVYGNNNYECIWNARIDSLPFIEMDVLRGLIWISVNTLDSDSVYHEEYHPNITIISNLSIVQRAKFDFPGSFNLLQNYPNPFNPETVIRYELKENNRIVLTVYDMLGKEILRLADEYQTAGRKSVVWDGCNKQGLRVSSGMYFYKLRAGKHILTKKMIFME